MGVRKTIVTTLAEYNIEVKHEGQVLRAFCPFHNDTGRPNFTLYEDTNSWYCWACKEGGDVISFVAKMENISYGAAKSRIEGVGVDLSELQEKIDGLGLEEEPVPVNLTLNATISKMVREFLRKHPGKVEATLPILKEFDIKALVTIAPQDIHKILATVQEKLQKLS